MKLRNVKRRFGRKIVAPLSAVAVGALASMQANAAVDAAVTTAITDATADITTVGSAIIVMAATAMGLRWVKATFF